MNPSPASGEAAPSPGEAALSRSEGPAAASREEAGPRREEVTVLYARFDHLPAPARMRAVAEHARSLDEAGYRSARAALNTADPDDRSLALFLAVVRRDLDAVGLALADPVLRPRALAAAIRLPVSETALEPLVLSPVRAVREDTYRVLRLSRRAAFADRMLPHVHERHGDAAARLLPACTPEAVGAWLPRFSAVPRTVLHRLARTAPLALAGHLASQPPAADRWEAGRLRSRYRHLTDVLTARDPEAAALLARRAPHLLTDRAARVLLLRPGRLAATLRQNGSPTIPIEPRALTRRARRALAACPAEDVALLADVLRVEHRGIGPGGAPSPAEPLLALLPPAERRRAVEERSVRGAGAWIGRAGTVAALDPADRTVAVRRLLEGRTGRRAYPYSAIVSLLPLAEAEGPLRELSTGDRPYERHLAWAALLRCAVAQDDPREFARILLSCERAWHDQEEVRRMALLAAGDAPGRLLAAAPYAALRDAAITTVQSRDSTAGTLAAAARLLRRTVVAVARAGDTECAARLVGLLLRVLADPRGSATATPLTLDGPAARALGERCGTPEGPELALLAGLFARHLAALPALDAALGRAVAADPLGDAGRTAAALRLADPATREARCAELLALEPSLATVPVLWLTLSRRRTDLLDAALGSGLPPGWAPRQTRRGLGRWLPHQRALLDARLARTAADEDVPLRERTDAAALLGDAGALYELAASAPQPVAAAAYAALGERAAESGGVAAHPATLDLLLERSGTGGVRGRGAAAGAGALLATVSDERAAARFARLLVDTTGSVGGRKAAARGLSALSSPAALAAMLGGWDAPGQHRDVLAVLVAPLAEHLDRPGVAERFAAQLHHRTVRERLAAVRPVRPEAAAARLRFLLRTAAAAEREPALAAAQALRGPAPADREMCARAVAVVADPDRPHPVRKAVAELLCGWAEPGPHHEDLVDALGALVDGARDGAPDVRRDALRVLAALEESHGDGPAGGHDAVADALERAGLRHAAARVALAAALAALAHGDPSPARWRRWLALAGERCGCLDIVRHQRLRPAGGPPPAADVFAAVLAVLREHASATAGLAAVQLVVRAGGDARWAEPWPAELDRLRASDHAEVAEAALLADLARPDA